MSIVDNHEQPLWYTLIALAGGIVLIGGMVTMEAD